MQAQGTAVSVTQAALAIVGAVIGSSLLTIAAFIFVLRFKRRRRDRRSMAAARDAGRPAREETGSGAGGGQSNDYSVNVKEPEPAVQTQRVGFATTIGANRASFRLRSPPKGKYSIFPRTRGETKRDEEAVSPTSEYSVGNEKEIAQGEARRSTMDSPPSLDKWLRAATNVSPFGTLNVSESEKAKKQIIGKNWPLGQKGSS